MRLKGKKKSDPTRQEYGAFAEAFDFFNRELFGAALTACYITLERKANARGYFSEQRFAHRVADERTDEIALNPAQFEGRTDEEILSTLVHEMTHQWQFLFGSPGRGRYHNHEWADRMEELGLMPSNTGLPGGKRTGQQMTHYIVPNGLFALACAKLLRSGFRLNWQARDPSSNGKKPGPDSSKVKYTCAPCKANWWGKSGGSGLCGLCGEKLIAEDGNTGPCPAYKNGQAAEPAPPSANGAPPDVGGTLKKWIREMTMKHHPDRTLDDGKVMAAINDAHDRLKELFGIA
jgi:hypothetical protein